MSLLALYLEIIYIFSIFRLGLILCAWVLLYSDKSGKSHLDQSLVDDLMKMVDESNLLVKEFRRVRDYVEQGISEHVALKLFRNDRPDSRMYNLPSVDEVAALIVGDFDCSDRGRDIILRTQAGHLQRVDENHKSFLPLQYPIIFPSGA